MNENKQKEAGVDLFKKDTLMSAIFNRTTFFIFQTFI